MSNIAGFLKSVPLFRSIPEGDIAAIAAGMGTEKMASGTTIFKQGDVGDAFYVISEGQCNVMVKPADFIKMGDEIKLT